MTVTFHASCLLQWQFSAGVLTREYRVVCHRSVPLKLQEVDVHIFDSGEAGDSTAEASTSGAQSHTVITVQAHGAQQPTMVAGLPGSVVAGCALAGVVASSE